MPACACRGAGAANSPRAIKSQVLRFPKVSLPSSNGWRGRIRTMTLSKTRSTALLLNIAHALDHMFLLIFATSVGAIAADFGISRWEDLMPYGVGAFVMFGLDRKSTRLNSSH